MPYTAAAPVSEAIFERLQDATLAQTLVGGVFGDVPESPTYPFCWYEIFRERDARGFGLGGLPEIEMRTHVFSERGGSLGGVSEAREANRQIVGLLKDAVLTVTGYTMCGRVFYRETVTLPDEELNGVKVHEVVSIFTIYVEEP